MRTHTKTFHIRFTEWEYERLCKHAEKAGLPKTTYIRHMINGCSPKEHPTEVFHAFMRELQYIGKNLNQLCRMVHQFGSLNAGRLDEIIKKYNQLYLALFKQAIQPEKVDIPAALERGWLLTEAEQNGEGRIHVE